MSYPRQFVYKLFKPSFKVRYLTFKSFSKTIIFFLKYSQNGCPCRNIFEACSVSGVPQGDLLFAILFYKRTLYMQIGRFSIKNVKCNLQGITVRLGTVSVGAIRFMSIRNKYGRTLVNPNFCSADTWS